MSPIQSAAIIGFAKESTYGTLATPTSFVPGLMTINDVTTVARPEQSRGTRDYVVDNLTRIEVAATVTAELIPEVLPKLFAGWFGTGSDTKTGEASTGFTHELVPKNLVPSYSFEYDEDASSQVLGRQLLGCNVDQLIVRNTQGALATCEFQLIGQREVTPATPGKPTNAEPVINAQQPIDFSRLTATYKGKETTQLQDFTMTLMNHVQRVFSSNKQIYAIRLVPTRREVQFQTTLDFLDTTFYNDWVAGSQTTEGFVLKYETPYKIEGSTGEAHKNIIEWTLPKLRPEGQFNIQAASDVFNQQLTWSAVLGTGGVVTCKVINGEEASLA